SYQIFVYFFFFFLYVAFFLGVFVFFFKLNKTPPPPPPPFSAAIIIDSTGYPLNKEGTYSITLKYKKRFKLSALTFPYFPITTGDIRVKKGKVYNVDFYLKEDTIPITDDY
ncbi:hypothetical protein, partial [Rufibacter quisquiliarum]|uniref:hypothetical protein n=2 Tax=Rufibacter quisquiliarum TaxID=1549639 RepID=UPI001C7268E1